MGNFKHQSLRDRDRDRDRDGDKDRERDIRDKEGQERLRNVSVDKYRFYHPQLMSTSSFLINTTAIDSLLLALGIKRETLRLISLSIPQSEGLLLSQQLLGEQKRGTVPRRRSAKSTRTGGEVITLEILSFAY
jgi:hypothetical protein